MKEIEAGGACAAAGIKHLAISACFLNASRHKGAPRADWPDHFAKARVKRKRLSAEVTRGNHNTQPQQRASGTFHVSDFGDCEVVIRKSRPLSACYLAPPASALPTHLHHPHPTIHRQSTLTPLHQLHQYPHPHLPPTPTPPQSP